MQGISYNKKCTISILLKLLLLISAVSITSYTQASDLQSLIIKKKDSIIPGADRTADYINDLIGKNVGVVANQTSVIGSEKMPLINSLLQMGIAIKKIFTPEHGFRGTVSNGSEVSNGLDTATRIPIISLYGKQYKPSKKDLEGLDIMVFDIQDVGVRFYTYISTLHYVMEACAENNLPLLILDRPNPNASYIDGPVLEEKYRSFVGMHPVPIVYGMTIGEYAQMINGESWLTRQLKCQLKIIKLANYKHDTPYELPIKPSPNLNTQKAILLYPSLCLFEGTVLSIGRGTLFPFQVIGHPALKGKYSFSFTPTSIPGMSEHPPQKDQVCYGIDLRKDTIDSLKNMGRINLQWLLACYKSFPKKDQFFNRFFTRLAGTESLQHQIENGQSESEIKTSWEQGLTLFKIKRQQYLLY